MQKIKLDAQTRNSMSAMQRNVKKGILGLAQFVVIVGICYVIVAPILGILVSSFMSDGDAYNPMVYMIPTSPTLLKYKTVIERLDYFPTMGRDLLYTLSLMIIQVLICSMVGYGFARFDFPLKKLLFACVVVMIVIPTNTIMLPLYMTFRNFNPFGLATLIKGKSINLLGTPVPMYIMTFLGCGLRSGLYIYIFNQFFRGLPSVITVAVFSMVWQYNDTFYAKLFLISENIVISKKISSLTAVIANEDKILDTTIQQLYLDAGIILIMVPIVLIYVFLQRYFIEGVERSGIVG